MQSTFLLLEFKAFILHMWPIVHNLYPSIYTRHVHAINVTQYVHKAKVEGELRAGPHLASMRWRCGCNATLSLKKRKFIMGELIAQ